MAYNVTNNFENNVRAVKLVLAWENGKALLAEDIEALKNFSGFGGIKPVLFGEGSLEAWEELGATESDLSLHQPLHEFYALLKDHFNGSDYKKIIDSLSSSALTAFYTPKIIPQAIYKALNTAGINPQRIYEPSAGAGVFITEAVTAFKGVKYINAVEKDVLTGRILTALNSHLPVRINTQITGFEETAEEETGKSDLIISNIPFGNLKIFDPEYKKPGFTNRIHNYFFAKGLSKLADGGIMAFLTTNAVLNTPDNKEIREYLFSSSDFISLSVMPDNLMQDNAGTQAPTHLLIVQKNDRKTELSADELLLTRTVVLNNSFGTYHLNAYIHQYMDSGIVMGETSEGKDQYGNPHLKVWQNGMLDNLASPLNVLLEKDILRRADISIFKAIFRQQADSLSAEQKYPTYANIPSNAVNTAIVQLDIFGASAENVNRAMAYLTDLDSGIVNQQTATPIAIIRDRKDPDKEAIVIITAKKNKSKQFVFKAYSNIEEVIFSAQWVNESSLRETILALRNDLADYLPTLQFEGDKDLEDTLGFYQAESVTVTENLPDLKPGSLIIYQDKIGVLQAEGQHQKVFKPFNNQANFDFYQKYLRLRDGYLELSATELAGNTADENLRSSVNLAYEELKARYGFLNETRNRRLVEADQISGFTVLASLERRAENGYIKADILTTSIVPKVEIFRTDIATDALARCLNDMGRIDPGFMESATGRRFVELREELRGHIYLNPETISWETADAYLSGNVVEKLYAAQAQAEIHPDDPAIAESITALKAVQPELIPFEILEFNLGERWIPVKYYQQYAGYLFETDTLISYVASADSFKVSPSERTGKITLEYVVSPRSGNKMYGHTLFEHALVNSAPHFTYEVGSGENMVRKPDNTAIQLAFEKIEQIRRGFITWLKTLPAEEKNIIEKIYNEKFNCFRLRSYDGSHLSFPGFVPEAVIKSGKLYASQRDATWRIVQNRGGLIDHAVGMGKTLIMILAAMEMRRLGIANKPMILALKANVGAIARDFRKAYPNAKILAPNEKDFMKQNRLRLFHEIRNNNWDCVILTHDQFGKIPQSPEVQSEILGAELECLQKDLDEILKKDNKASKQMLKGLQKRKSNLIVQLKTIQESIDQKKDTGIDFTQMGIDHLFIDESHSFKNLTYTTRHNQVAGLSNPIGVQKALNLLFAIRTLQKKFDSDLCVTFLSGTIISNSLTELYIIFKYLLPRELKRQNIENFDSWAAVFAEKSTQFEFNVTNEIKAKERFRTFIKIPELGLLLNTICDYKTASDIKQDKPRLIEKLIAIPPTPEESEYAVKLMEFARTGNASFIGRAQLTEKEDKGRMLIATNYAKKMAVDMRLIDSMLYSDHPDNKINICTRNVADIYRQTTEHLGTQVIFCDLGIPGPGFNVYDAVKNKLVNDFNIPAAQIAFIHDCKDDDQKTKLYDLLNEGKIRVLITSRTKGGVGTNYQKRMVAGHSIDIPWRPSDMVQADGRYARTGNEVAKMFYNNTVYSFIYAKERSLDTYKFNLLKAKQLFISQIKNGNVNIRRLDEGAYDDQIGMAYTEYIAQLSGNTSLLEKEKLNRKISVLESSRMIHMRQTAGARMDLSANEGKRDSALAMLNKIETDMNQYERQLTYQKDGTKNNPIILDKFPSADAAEIGAYLIDQYKNWNKNIQEELTEKIGGLFGFGLYIRRGFGTVPRSDFGYDKIWENKYELKSTESGITYNSNQGIPNVDNPKLAARIFLNAIDKVYSLKSHYEKQLEEARSNIRTLEVLVVQPFEHEEQLTRLKDELQILDKEIKAEINDKQEENIDEDETPELAQTPAVPLSPSAAAVVSLKKVEAETNGGESRKLISKQTHKSFSKFKSGR
jgi:N12 class adenine-specific DNA methylase